MIFDHNSPQLWVQVSLWFYSVTSNHLSHNFLNMTNWYNLVSLKCVYFLKYSKCSTSNAHKINENTQKLLIFFSGAMWCWWYWFKWKWFRWNKRRENKKIKKTEKERKENQWEATIASFCSNIHSKSSN